jgi:predicted phosphodiesterase
MGNCDVWFPQWPLPYEDNLTYAQVAWAAEKLSPEDRAFIAGFQPTVTVQLGGTTLLCFHGSPRSNSELIVSTTPEDELGAMLAGYESDVMIGGHTHAQMVRRLPGALLVNAGSIGMPFAPPIRDVNPPWAEWATVEASDEGLSVALRRTPLDVEAMVAGAAETDMPGLDRWTANRRQGAEEGR